MTLKQLAARMDSSAARLSQIENDQIWLDLNRGARLLVRAGSVDGRAATAGQSSLPFQIVRDGEPGGQPLQPMLLHGHGDRPPLTLPHSFRPLADLFMGRHMEPVLGRIEPVADASVAVLPSPRRGIRVCPPRARRVPHQDARRREARGTLSRRLRATSVRTCHTPFARSMTRPAETLQVFSSPSASSGAGLERTTFQAIAHDDDVDSGDLLPHVGEKLRLLREVHGVDRRRRRACSGAGRAARARHRAWPSSACPWTRS